MLCDDRLECAVELPLSNEEIAQRLDEAAALLESQEANPFRVRAYQSAAETVRRLPQPVYEIVDAKGPAGLRELPGIGASLAETISRLTFTGRFDLLDRIRGEAGPESIFTTLPGIGDELARRIHDELGIDTLVELEMAAYDGRLRRVPGMGRRRIQAIRDSLAGRFRRRPRLPVEASDRMLPFRATATTSSSSQQERQQQRADTDEPPVSELLDVDAEYRRRAEAGTLRMIAPRRFNPKGVAWLPVLHTRRGDREYTALFSNTALAHQLGMTHDWVVIYRDDAGGRGQWTAVTARVRPLRGRRVIRGREAECLAHYERSGKQAQASE